MKRYRHNTTGEIMTVHPGQSVGEVLAASPSWEDITQEAKEEITPEAKEEITPEAKEEITPEGLTVKDIKSILDEKAIPYTAKDNKAALVELLAQAED